MKKRGQNKNKAGRGEGENTKEEKGRKQGKETKLEDKRNAKQRREDDNEGKPSCRTAPDCPVSTERAPRGLRPSEPQWAELCGGVVWDSTDLLEVEGVEQALGGAEAMAVGPSQQQQQAGQRPELPLQQHLQPGELLPLDQVQARHLGTQGQTSLQSGRPSFKSDRTSFK